MMKQWLGPNQYMVGSQPCRSSSRKLLQTWVLLMLTLPTRKFYSFMNWPSMPIYPQGYFIPIWTDLLCWSRLSFVIDWYSHCHQGYLIPLWTDFIGWYRFTFLVAWYTHFPQEYFIPSWADLLCWTRFPFCVAWYSHCPQGHLLKET